MIQLGSVSFHESLKVERESEDQAEILTVDRTGLLLVLKMKGPCARKAGSVQKVEKARK